MFDQVFEGFRKASESSILAQQEMVKQWAQQWPSASLSAVGSAIERNRTLQKRWVQEATESLNRHRELVDSFCRASIQIAEQTARMSDAKSPDDYRRSVEQIWRDVFDTFKRQSEAQLAELKKVSEAWLETAQEPLKAKEQPKAKAATHEKANR